MSAKRKYVIVDDDNFNNALCKRMLMKTLGEVDVTTFSSPEESLSYLERTYNNEQEKTILFLDINMPTLNAWEFLEEYDKFPEVIKEQIAIYILSSSVHKSERDKAAENKYVKGFFSKPLTAETILNLVNDIKKG